MRQRLLMPERDVMRSALMGSGTRGMGVMLSVLFLAVVAAQYNAAEKRLDTRSNSTSAGPVHSTTGRAAGVATNGGNVQNIQGDDDDLDDDEVSSLLRPVELIAPVELNEYDATGGAGVSEVKMKAHENGTHSGDDDPNAKRNVGHRRHVDENGGRDDDVYIDRRYDDEDDDFNVDHRYEEEDVVPLSSIEDREQLIRRHDTRYPAAIGSAARPSKKLEKCGDVDIDPEGALCCNGLVYRKSVGKAQCCGNVAFDAEHYLCCRGQAIIQKRGVLPRCCGDYVIDAFRETCKNGYEVDRTDLGSTCCLTSLGWKCCLKGENCCDTDRRSAVDVPGFRPACCGIDHLETSAQCCAQTYERSNVLAECCDNERLRPTCCRKTDGSLRCCPSTWGYCCVPSDRIVIHTTPAPRPTYPTRPRTRYTTNAALALWTTPYRRPVGVTTRYPAVRYPTTRPPYPSGRETTYPHYPRVSTYAPHYGGREPTHPPYPGGRASTLAPRGRPPTYPPYPSGREPTHPPYHGGREPTYPPYHGGREPTYPPYHGGREPTYPPYHGGREPTYPPYHGGREPTYPPYHGGREPTYPHYPSGRDPTRAPSPPHYPGGPDDSDRRPSGKQCCSQRKPSCCSSGVGLGIHYSRACCYIYYLSPAVCCEQVAADSPQISASDFQKDGVPVSFRPDAGKPRRTDRITSGSAVAPASTRTRENQAIKDDKHNSQIVVNTGVQPQRKNDEKSSGKVGDVSDDVDYHADDVEIGARGVGGRRNLDTGHTRERSEVHRASSFGSSRYSCCGVASSAMSTCCSNGYFATGRLFDCCPGSPSSSSQQSDSAVQPKKNSYLEKHNRENVADNGNLHQRQRHLTYQLQQQHNQRSRQQELREYQHPQRLNHRKHEENSRWYEFNGDSTNSQNGNKFDVTRLLRHGAVQQRVHNKHEVPQSAKKDIINNNNNNNINQNNAHEDAAVHDIHTNGLKSENKNSPHVTLLARRQHRCNETTYDSHEFICCAGHRRLRVGTAPACCGNIAYDTFEFKCCDGLVDTSCDRSVPYAPTKNFWSTLV